jgi:hypothetical protein
MDRGGGRSRPPGNPAKILKNNKLKFRKSEEIALLFGPFFAIIFSWIRPTGSRDVPAPETRIFKQSGWT